MAKPYDQIPDRRAIVRRRALEDALAALVEDLPTGAEPPRPAVVALLREALATGRAQIPRRIGAPQPLRTHRDEVARGPPPLPDGPGSSAVSPFPPPSASTPPPIPAPPSGWAW